MLYSEGNDRETVHSERRSAGRATQTSDRDRVAARAEARDQLTQEELDRRQEQVGARRRPAGPPLEGPAAPGNQPGNQPAAEAPGEVPETEVADPPDQE